VSDVQPSGSGFTVLVEEEAEVPVTPAELTPGTVREEGAITWVRTKVLRHKQLDIGAVEQQLDRVQGEVDGLLERLSTPPKAGFRLSQVQVSVGMSAQGTIAVVTAGIQASLTLVYENTG